MRLKRKLLEVYNKIRFALWRTISVRRHGERRWIIAHGRRMRVKCQDWRGYWLSRNRGSQHALVRVWRGLAQATPDIAIDVGANYGEFTGAAVDVVKRIVAIEANPSLVICLKETFADSVNVEIVAAAAGHENGSTVLYLKPSMSGYSSVLREFVAENRSPAGIEEALTAVSIKQVAVSDLMRERAIQAASAIIKIDVEGFEKEVLMGALDFLGRLQWWRAVIEFNPRATLTGRDTADSLWDFYRQFNGVIIPKYGGLPPSEPWSSQHLGECPKAQANIIIGLGEIS